MGTIKVRALFLDRDGTINVDYGYVYEPERFVFMEGVFELCQAAQAAGMAIIIISNQSGVSRGYYTREQMDACNSRMVEMLRSGGVEVLDVLCCTALDDADPRRKPNPGMFLEAIGRHRVDARRSVAVGDGERDAVAARRAGVGTVLLLAKEPPAATAADATVGTLFEAIRFLNNDAGAEALAETGKGEII